MILSALGFALMGLCVKLAGSRGFPVLELIFARAVISLILCYVDIRRHKIFPWGRNIPLLWLRGIIGFVALLGVYKSLTLLPLAEATLIQYLYPIFTAFLAYCFLQEQIQISTVLSIILGICGVYVLADPQVFGGAKLQVIGVYAGLLGAAGSGAAYTLVRHLSHTEHPSVIILYFPLVCCPLSLILGWRGFIMPQGSDWILLVAIGLFTQLGQVGLTKGMSLISASRAASYSYVQVLFAVLLGGFVLGEKLSFSTIIGAFLIFSGLIVTKRHS